MNDEKLMLDCFNWLISNSNSTSDLQDEERKELLMRIDCELNPEVEPTIAERTHDALSQKTEVKKDE